MAQQNSRLHMGLTGLQFVGNTAIRQSKWCKIVEYKFNSSPFPSHGAGGQCPDPHWLLVQPPNHGSQFLCTKTAGKLSGWPSPRGVQAFRRPFLWISWIWCFAVTRQRTTARQGETCCQAIRDPLATFIGHVISLFRRKPRKFTGLSSSGLTVLPAKWSFHHETLAILPNIMEKRTGYMRFIGSKNQPFLRGKR